MSVYAELHDGRRLEFPDGTDPAVIQATVKKVLAQPPAAAAQPAADEFVSDADLAIGSRGGRLALGAASPFIASAQLGANIGDFVYKSGLLEKFGIDAGDPVVGKKVNEWVSELEKSKERGMKAHGETGFDWMGLLGSLAGGGAVAKGVMPNAKTFFGKVGRGAATGAIYGAATPVVGEDKFLSNKAGQVALGAAAGTVAPVITSGAGVGMNLGKKIFRIGEKKVAAQTLNELAGAKQPRILAELKKNRTYLPRSKPTAGEAAARVGSTEFSAAQAEAAKLYRPSEYMDIEKANQAARRAAISKVSGGQRGLSDAIAARGAQSKDLYGKAWGHQLQADKELAAMYKNDYFRAALPVALRIARAEGVKPGPAGRTRLLHLVKKELDSKLAGTSEEPIDKIERGVVQDIKSKLVDWLKAKNPNYEKARASFAAASKPINQMSVGKELESKLVGALDSKEGSAAFARATKDAASTIKRATGEPRFDKLSQVLDPDQVSAVKGISLDLQRAARHKELARAGSAKIRAKMGEKPPEEMARILHRVVVIYNSIVATASGKATKRTWEEIGRIMQDPAETAKAMEMATPAQRSAFRKLINEYSRTAASGALAIPAAKQVNE